MGAWKSIAPNGKTVGLEINEKTLRDVSQTIGSHIEPRIYPHIEQQNRDGKSRQKMLSTNWSCARAAAC